MDLYSLILGSSTPDGLAPLSQTAAIVFASVLTALPILWACLNLFLLVMKPLPGQEPSDQQQGQQGGPKEQQVFLLLCQRIMWAAIDFLKYNFAVSLFAGIIFFLIIFGAIEHFDDSTLALAYLYGLLECIFIGVVVAIASQISLSRISYASSSSLFAAHLTAKNISNFVGYFVPGLTTLVFFLIFLLSQDKSPEEMLLEDIKKVGRALMAFTFGISTAAIGTKINSVIYGKASEGALPMMNQMEPKLPRNHANPVIVCKSVGENVRKVVSNALDYNMYLCVSLVCAVVAATSVIGADQQGEIVFDHSVSNCYLPLLAFCFLLFFSVVASAVSLAVFSPESGQEAALIFKRETYIVVFFMIGFLALAAYLCLPIEFFLQTSLTDLKSPHLAYLVLLVSFLAMFLLMFVSEFQINHPQSLYSVIGACKNGPASSLLSGLSFGYLGNIPPICIWAGLSFLCYYWLGGFGSALMAVGIALMIPNSLSANTYFASIENASFISYIGELGDEAMGNLMAISQNRRLYEIQVHSHFTSMALAANFAITLNFVEEYGLTKVPLTNPGVYAGLLLGAMLIYSFGAIVLLAIQQVTPVLCYDMRAQIEQNPDILSGTVEPDCPRSNFIFSLNTILQLKYFLPFLYVPFLIIGLVFGARMTLGLVIGMMISGLQLAFSSGLSGNIWNSARTEIFLGRARDEENEPIKAESESGVAVDVGNEVGLKLKDAIGSSVHGYITFVSLTSVVMAALYPQQ